MKKRGDKLVLQPTGEQKLSEPWRFSATHRVWSVGSIDRNLRNAFFLEGNERRAVSGIP